MLAHSKQVEIALHHLEEACSLLPLLFQEPPGWKDTSGLLRYCLTLSNCSEERCKLDKLERGLHTLEMLGELNDCPPEFHRHLEVTAEQLHEVIDVFISRQLEHASRMLRLLEYDLENGDELTVSTMFSVAQPLDLLRLKHDYGRMSSKQSEDYTGLLAKFNLVLPSIERAKDKLPSATSSELSDILTRL